MLENKTVKYHIPQNGIYVYVRTNESKTEMIVLNSTDKEQVLPNNHYNILTKDHKEGKDGYLVEKNNTEMMADKIFGIIRTPQLALELTRRARKKAESFGWTSVSKLWRQTFGINHD